MAASEEGWAFPLASALEESLHSSEMEKEENSPHSQGTTLPGSPLIEGSLEEGRKRKNARETIPAEKFSDSRTVCGAEKIKTRKKRGGEGQKWLHLQETSMHCIEG